MKGSLTVLCLLLGVAGAASAATVTLDFNDTKNSTANAQLITSNAGGAVKNVNIGGRNAVQTGGDGTNDFLYVQIPKGTFDKSKALWTTVEYYDQGTDTFTLAFDNAGTETNVTENPVTKHDTKAWTSHTFTMPGFKLTQGLLGGADVKLDDLGDGPEVVDKIVVTDEDPNLTHFPHVDPAHPIKIDGKIDPGEWDGAYTVTLNTAAQDALAGANWGGPADFSGTYYHKWDENGLYVRGDVTDATPRLNTETGDRAWNGDGIEEFLALDWSDPTHTSYLDKTDFHVFIGLGDTPQWGVQTANGDNDKGAIPAENLAIKNTDNPKGYQFELFLPWKLLLDDVQNTTTKITAGQKIGWFMFANNSKDSPSAQQVAMSPYSRTHPSGNPSVWATVVLEPVPTTPAAGGGTPTAGP